MPHTGTPRISARRELFSQCEAHSQNEKLPSRKTRNDLTPLKLSQFLAQNAATKWEMLLTFFVKFVQREELCCGRTA
jgi:hypothetical protein